MTEEEAKTKWCCGPAATAPAIMFASGRVRVDGKSAMIGACLGSECMAWRWSPGRVVNQGFREERTLEPTEGYCGLAGVVQ